MKAALPQTVLVVDTDPLQLLRAKNALSSEGARVLACEDPVRALPLIEWENVDVVVCEVRMPSLNGIDLLTRVRRLFPEVVRIVLTVDATAPTMARAINEAEVFRYLLKPVKAAELNEAVRLALARVTQARRVVSADKEAARHAAELEQMERSCPGLSEVPPHGHIHSIGASRIWELSVRAVGGPLDGWLPG